MKHFILSFSFIIPFAFLSQHEFVVYFPTDQAYMLHSSKLDLNKLIESKQIKLVTGLKGYADTTSTNAYNKTLAQNRILDIKHYLHLQNVSISKNINCQSFGENFEQDNELSKNRKVVIQYEKTSAPSSTKHQIQKLEIGESLILKHLNFEPGLDKFRDIAYPVLKDLLAIMIERKDLHIKIHGHICCTIGDPQNLSTQRALKVKNYLISNGISSDRLSHLGHGSSKPIHPLPEQNEAQMKENRRVEIEITSVNNK